VASPPPDPVIRFSLASVDAFAEASHDVNPLHTSEDYARRTPFGQRVVHGMLATLACLARLPPRPGQRLARLQVDFKGVLFAEVPYQLDVAAGDRRIVARVLDGRRVALKLVLDLAPGAVAAAGPRPGQGLRAVAARWGLADLEEGWSCEGSYGPAPGGEAALARHLPLRDEVGVGPWERAILMASSWLVGMNAPGERALFSRAIIELAPETPAAAPAPDAALGYRLSVVERDDRFEMVEMAVSFTAGAEACATAQLQAFVRAEPAELDAARLRALAPPGRALAGKTAVVVGASRGLGAAIALGLADQGCHVGLVFARSREAAERVAGLAAPDAMSLLQVDAADSAAFDPAVRAFAAARGGLDILVCNGCPALVSLSLDTASVPRILEHVSQSFALVATPVAATLDLLEARAGALVTISSPALLAPPAGWSHYVAAKGALEAFHRAAVAQTRQVRGLIVRPPRLRTDLVSTPGSNEPALAPEVVAAALVRRLVGLERAEPAVLEVFEEPG
jgi:NAD(P)-dependent dehydrogenase (short-subunit alcohol dehydrogenase family)